MEDDKEEELLRDWSNMATDMLEKFCKCLTISNQVRFSTVCKTWLSANTTKKAHYWIPDAPWLVSKDYISVQFQVISNTDKQAYKIFKPYKPLQGTSIVGSCKGWLVLRSKFKLFILNLFSELHLDLPPLSSVSCLLCSKGDNCLNINMPLVFAISTCSNMNPTSVALVTHNGCLRWCKVGDTAWTCHHTSGEFYANVAFHNGKLYVVDQDGEKVNTFKYGEGGLVQVGSVETTEPNEVLPLSRPIDKRVYLVECAGRVLVVRRINDFSVYQPTVSFVISAVDENSSMPGRLVEVQSLDDHILFVANSDIECLDAKYCPEFQRGCVYFTYTKNDITPEVRQFSIANRTIVRSCSPPMIPHMMKSPVWMLPRFPFDCDCKQCTSAPWIKLEKMEEALVQQKISYV